MTRIGQFTPLKTSHPSIAHETDNLIRVGVPDREGSKREEVKEPQFIA